jgi:hypothetical protein
MANPDPPPNSLGLDIVQSEPTSDAQSTSANSPSPSPQQPSADVTDSVATDTPSSPTTPATGTEKVDDDATKPNLSKKTPYVNPERVKTGGLPRVNLVSL